jgi:hypothetical protein
MTDKKKVQPITAPLRFLKKLLDRAETYAVENNLDEKTVKAVKKARKTVVANSKAAAVVAGDALKKGQRTLADAVEARTTKKPEPVKQTPAKKPAAKKPAAKSSATKAAVTQPAAKKPAAKPVVKAAASKKATEVKATPAVNKPAAKKPAK